MENKAFQKSQQNCIHEPLAFIVVLSKYILVIMKEEKDKKSGNGNGIGTGAALGVAFGTAYGISSGNISSSIAMGLAIGVAVGAIFDFTRKNKTTKR